MLLIVGLGNPGEKYEKSRHNAGFIFLDRFEKAFRERESFSVENWRLSDKFNAWHLEITNSSKQIHLLKPNTFMNASGIAVSKFINWYKAKSTRKVVVVYDDLDLPLGEYKIGENYPQGHNGVLSVVQNIGAGSFLGIRLGTDNREGQREQEVKNFVLEKMTEDELVLLYRAIDDAIIAFERDYSGYFAK